MADFLRMGGYGFYVWVSYGLAVLVLIYNIWLPLSCERRLKRRLARQVKGRGA